jgi:hypothetical protein
MQKFNQIRRDFVNTSPDAGGDADKCFEEFAAAAFQIAEDILKRYLDAAALVCKECLGCTCDGWTAMVAARQVAKIRNSMLNPEKASFVSHRTPFDNECGAVPP